MWQMSVNKCTVGVYLHFCPFFQVFLCLSENLQFFPNPSFSKSLKLSQKSFNDKNLFCTTHIFRTTRFCMDITFSCTVFPDFSSSNMFWISTARFCNRSCMDITFSYTVLPDFYCTILYFLQSLWSSLGKLISGPKKSGCKSELYEPNPSCTLVEFSRSPNYYH